MGDADGDSTALTPADLDRTITIRKEPFLVVEALNRSLAHTAYHVGQIVLPGAPLRRPRLDVADDPEGGRRRTRRASSRQRADGGRRTTEGTGTEVTEDTEFTGGTE